MEDLIDENVTPVMPDLDVYDAGDPADVEEMSQAAKRQTEYDRKMWDVVLDSRAGRYVLYDILSNMARPFETSARVDNVNLTFFREGERNIGQQIVAKVGFENLQRMNEEAENV